MTTKESYSDFLNELIELMKKHDVHITYSEKFNRHLFYQVDGNLIYSSGLDDIIFDNEKIQGRLTTESIGQNFINTIDDAPIYYWRKVGKQLMPFRNSPQLFDKLGQKE